jgi:ankyrin repeat protein
VIYTTALVMAAGRGRLEVARLLLEGGADPSLADSDGRTPLMSATADGQREVLRLLLARGAAVDAAEPRDGWTAFHVACANNQAECAKALVRAGCDVGIKDSHGQTGRELAEGQGHATVVEQLRAVVGEQLRAAQAAGPAPAPEPAAVVGDGGPADQLLDAVRKDDAAAVARLLAAGADPNASVPLPTRSGEVSGHSTVLCVAVVLGRLEAARLLLEAGADPSIATPDGATPLTVAARNGQPEVLRLLLGRGAAVDAVEPVSSWTAFHMACYRNQAECAEALARAGCDVSLKINNGSRVSSSPKCRAARTCCGGCGPSRASRSSGCSSS